MTRQEAIQTAAEWWFRMIRSGKWDNHDASTESSHSFFKSMAYQPTEEDFLKLRPGLVEMIQELVVKSEVSKYPSNRTQLYADYGCGPLDDLYKRLGLAMKSCFHCPQKAGTTIIREGEDYTVEAKSGYGGEWVRLALEEHSVAS